jgi:hypothetical protein
MLPAPVKTGMQACGVSYEFVPEVTRPGDEVPIRPNSTPEPTVPQGHWQCGSIGKPVCRSSAKDHIDLGAFDVLAGHLTLISAVRHMGGECSRGRVRDLTCADQTHRTP